LSRKGIAVIRRLGSIFIVIVFLFGTDKVLSQTRGGDTPLAQVDGKIITVQEFMQRIIKLPPFFRAALQTEEDRRMALDWIIDRELMLADGLQMGVDREPKVEVSIASAREQIIVSEYLNRQVREKVVIPEIVLQEYYVNNREEFKLSEEIKVSQILTRSEMEAEEILEELKKGADFSKLARERSVDPSRRNGGQMGWLERRVMDYDFAKAAFSLANGAMSGVVHSQFGYHIIKVDDKKPPEYAGYDDVKEGIRERMTRKRAQEKVEQLRKILRAKAKITIDQEILKAMKPSGDTETPPLP
jgi:peptidyl-prolyl cis-trans isomerase C